MISKNKLIGKLFANNDDVPLKTEKETADKMLKIIGWCSLIIAMLIVSHLIIFVDKGVDLSDEGVYVIHMQSDQTGIKDSFWNGFQQNLMQNADFVSLRIWNLILSSISCLIFCFAFISVLKSRKIFYPLPLIIGMIVIFKFVGPTRLPFSFSYNNSTQLGLTLCGSMMLFYLSILDKRKLLKKSLLAFFAGVFLSMTIFARTTVFPPTFLFLISLVIFDKSRSKREKKYFTLFIIIGSMLFFSFYSLAKGGFNHIFSEFYDTYVISIATDNPSESAHSFYNISYKLFKYLFIFIAKISVLVTCFCLTKLFFVTDNNRKSMWKKFSNIVLVGMIFSVSFLGFNQHPNEIVLFIAMSFLVYFIFERKTNIIKEKQLIAPLVFLPIFSYTVGLGSSNNLASVSGFLLNYSLGFILIVFSLLREKKWLINVLLILMLVALSSMFSYYRHFSPYRSESMKKQTAKIKMPSGRSIFVTEDIRDLISDIKKDLKEIEDREIIAFDRLHGLVYLIDCRYPIDPTIFWFPKTIGKVHSDLEKIGKTADDYPVLLRDTMLEHPRIKKLISNRVLISNYGYKNCDFDNYNYDEGKIYLYDKVKK